MAYTPQLPLSLVRTQPAPDSIAGSHIGEKAVTTVTTVTDIENLTLAQFSRQGRAIRVRVPWLPETLWFVPGLDHVGRLMAQGVRRGCIWTAGELTDLTKIGTGMSEATRTIARVKLDFDAELESIDVPRGQAESDSTTAREGM